MTAHPIGFCDSSRIDAITSDPVKNIFLIQIFSALGLDPDRLLLTDASTFSDFLWSMPHFDGIDYSWLDGEDGQAYINRLAEPVAERMKEKLWLMFDAAPADIFTTTVVDFFDSVFDPTEEL